MQKRAYKRKDTWVCGIMIDLNGFKAINDTYGHAEGDTALILAAGLLKNAFGEYGVVTRYAGDEFVVILNTADEQLVQSLIARGQRRILRRSTGRTTSPTVSPPPWATPSPTCTPRPLPTS